MMAKTLNVFCLVLLAAFTLQAQQVVSQKRFVVVNEMAFYDEKTGITKLVKAFDLAINPGFISEKDEQKRKEIFEQNYKFRQSQIVEPVLQEITEAIRKIESENNLVVLQVGEMVDKNHLLAINQRFEITKQFIAFFNKQSKNTTEVLRLDIQDSKVASVDTLFFFDKNHGIRKLTEAIDNKGYTAGNVCQQTVICTDIGKVIQTFVDSKGYSLIFDSSRKLPDAVKDVKVEDVTKDFISFFNNK